MSRSFASTDLELVCLLNKMFNVKKTNHSTPVKLIQQGHSISLHKTPLRESHNSNMLLITSQQQTPTVLVTEPSNSRTVNHLGGLDLDEAHREKASKSCSRNLDRDFAQQPFRSANNSPIVIQHQRNHTQGLSEHYSLSKRSNSQAPSMRYEELLILDSKLSNLLSIVSKEKNPAIACCDLWAFYFSSSFIRRQEDFFTQPSSKVIIRSFSNLLLLTLILGYDISFEFDLLIQLNMLFRTIFTLLQLNQSVISKHVMSQLNQDEPLIKTFTQHLNQRINGKAAIEMKEKEIVTMVKHNSTSMADLIKLILNNIQQHNDTFDELMFNFYNLSCIEANELKDFFVRKIFREDMQLMRGLLVTSGVGAKNRLNRPLQPFLPLKTAMKEYTLCLGLDEVLISFEFIQVENDGSKKGIMHLRPGLSSFLEKSAELFELVLFTSATRAYSEPILKAIEKKGTVFDYRLYREHCSLVKEEYVKELSKLGRDVSKVIIVDNNADSFKMNKENGITIQSFYGSETTDSVLGNLLSILIDIANEHGCDVRQLLRKYRNDITQSVSSSFCCFRADNPLT